MKYELDEVIIDNHENLIIFSPYELKNNFKIMYSYNIGIKILL